MALGVHKRLAQQVSSSLAGKLLITVLFPIEAR